jgi:hypothetical protein
MPFQVSWVCTGRKAGPADGVRSWNPRFACRTGVIAFAGTLCLRDAGCMPGQTFVLPARGKEEWYVRVISLISLKCRVAFIGTLIAKIELKTAVG